MANDAKLGLIAGVVSVLVIAVVYYQKQDSPRDAERATNVTIVTAAEIVPAKLVRN